MRFGNTTLMYIAFCWTENTVASYPSTPPPRPVLVIVAWVSGILSNKVTLSQPNSPSNKSRKDASEELVRQSARDR